MSLIEHAKSELDRINFGDEDTSAMLGILRRFFDQWDSGGAVACVAPILTRLIAGQPISPLTGTDDEWYKPMDNHDVWQNVRCGTVFKEADGRAYDIDLPVPPGEERAYITFPYDPDTRQVQPPVYQVG